LSIKFLPPKGRKGEGGGRVERKKVGGFFVRRVGTEKSWKTELGEKKGKKKQIKRSNMLSKTR